MAVTLLFAVVCLNGTAFLVATPLLQAASKLNAESLQSGCREKASTVVVLGGGAVTADIPSTATSLRVLEAAKFVRAKLQKNESVKIVVVLSGGPASSDVPVAETVPMEHFLRLELGELVSRVKILQEDKSKNTFQNAVFTKELVEKKGMLKNILLVTSALHLPRAAGTFKRVGLNVCTLSAPSLEINSPGFMSFANGERLMRVVNEYAGKLGYRARGWM